MGNNIFSDQVEGRLSFQRRLSFEAISHLRDGHLSYERHLSFELWSSMPGNKHILPQNKTRTNTNTCGILRVSWASARKKLALAIWLKSGHFLSANPRDFSQICWSQFSLFLMINLVVYCPVNMVSHMRQPC